MSQYLDNYFRVSFQYSENVYCVNIAIARNMDDVKAHYSKYTWCAVQPATEGDVKEAKRKGTPIISVKHQEPTAADIRHAAGEQARTAAGVIHELKRDLSGTHNAANLQEIAARLEYWRGYQDAMNAILTLL